MTIIGMNHSDFEFDNSDKLDDITCIDGRRPRKDETALHAAWAAEAKSGKTKNAVIPCRAEDDLWLEQLFD